MGTNTHPDYSKWRAWTLFSVWVFFALHMIHWRLNETTLAPLELNEVLYTIHQGIVTAGFILMVVIMIATLIFGRFFCSWGCHILSLQDASSWVLKKLKIRSRPIRSRSLIWVPMGAMLYLFVWPQVKMLIYGVETQAFHIVENTNGQWSSFVTDDFWRNLPPVEIALSTFFIVGFLLIYLMGSRSFCWYGCPYGALFGIADQMAPGRIKLIGTCVDCGVCTANCSSDILVHKEIQEFGMVTNSRCMKDLDCVANCPENALSFGFKTPPLFRSQFKLDKYNDRYSFTLTEDILMSVVFIISVLVFRGLYGVIPFLMSVGMSVAVAYGTVLLLRLFTKSSASINNLRLKISGKIKPAGYSFLLIATVTVALTIHSGVVQYHTQLGKYWYEQLSNSTIDQPEQGPDADLANKAKTHLESSLKIGLLQPIFIRTELASVYNILGNKEASKALLNGIVEQDSDNLKSHYRLGNMEMISGNLEEAKTRFTNVVSLKPDDGEEYFMKSVAYVNLGNLALSESDLDLAQQLFLSATETYDKNEEAWLSLGKAYHATGKTKEAIYCLNKVLELNPNSTTAHHNLGAIYSTTDNRKMALGHFQNLTRLQPNNYVAHYNLGMLQFQSGQLQKAELSLKQALKLNPNHENSIIGLSNIEKLIENQN